MRETSMRAITVTMLILGASGCKKAIEAPSDVEEMMNFAFVHYADEDEQPLRDVAINMREFVTNNLDAAEEGWKVNSLSTEDLQAAGIDKDTVEDIIGASASVPYRNALDPVADAITWEDKTEVFPHVLEYEVLSSSDRPCFLQRNCSNLDFDIRQVASASILGEATLDQNWEMRWIGLEEEGYEPMYFIRTLAPDGVEFSSGLARVHQQYSIAAIYPSDGAARRLEAYWVEIEVFGMNLPENYGVNQAIAQMGKSAEDIDNFIENGPLEE
jgi:hypothetical protein